MGWWGKFGVFTCSGTGPCDAAAQVMSMVLVSVKAVLVVCLVYPLGFLFANKSDLHVSGLFWCLSYCNSFIFEEWHRAC